MEMWSQILGWIEGDPGLPARGWATPAGPGHCRPCARGHQRTSTRYLCLPLPPLTGCCATKPACQRRLRTGSHVRTGNNPHLFLGKLGGWWTDHRPQGQSPVRAGWGEWGGRLDQETSRTFPPRQLWQHLIFLPFVLEGRFQGQHRHQMLLQGNGSEIVPAALSVSVRWNSGASPARPWVSGADGDNNLLGFHPLWRRHH